LGSKPVTSREGPHHHVEGVRDDDGERVGAVLLRVLGDVLDDREVDADEVVAALAGLAGTPAVMMSTSQPAQSAQSEVPTMFAS
jgi:hypothetical protein